MSKELIEAVRNALATSDGWEGGETFHKAALQEIREIVARPTITEAEAVELMLKSTITENAWGCEQNHMTEHGAIMAFRALEPYLNVRES